MAPKKETKQAKGTKAAAAPAAAAAAPAAVAKKAGEGINTKLALVMKSGKVSCTTHAVVLTLSTPSDTSRP